MKVDLSIKIGKMKMKNPVMVASGTFGYAEEYRPFINLKQLGAVVTKTITLNPRQGNPMPRTCEVPGGMLNSIGLKNPGLQNFLKDKLTLLKNIGVPIIISIASERDPEEFVVLARKLDKIKEVAAIELNISCPNIGHRSLVIGHRLNQKHPTSALISQSAEATYEVVKMVRKATTKTLITKLSPNVTDIGEIAQAAQNAGSDAVSLINTLTGMSIDTDTAKPKIACVIAGLSGPAIRPVAVRMVYDVFRKIKIPIIGMGGIIDAQSALEFFLAGATAVAVGTANFINPKASMEIITGLKDYLLKKKIRSVLALTGSLKA